MLGGLSMQALKGESDHLHLASCGVGRGGHIYPVTINTGACSLTPFSFLCTLSECQMKDPDLSSLAFKTL